MANSIRTIGIIVASAIALVFISIAFLISGPLPFHTNTASAESTHDLLVAYAAKDSDNDGLPDWEEVLYGTDPNNPHSVSPTLTDGEAVAKGLIKPKFASATSTPVSASSIPGVAAGSDTVTGQFAQQLFGQYLAQNGGTSPTPAAIATFVEQHVADVKSQHAVPDAFNQGQVHVVGTGPVALTAYAVAAEAAFAKNTVTLKENEVEYFADAVEKNDKTAPAQIKKIGTYYTVTSKLYLAIPAPKEAAVPHLAVANALARLGGDITDMSTLGTDPLRAYLGLANYQTDGPAFLAALAALESVYAAEQVTIQDGVAGSSFYKTLVKSSTPQTTP